LLESHSVAEELQLFEKRLSVLSEIITKLGETPQNCRIVLFQQLPQYKSQLYLLQAYIKSADSLNTGGAFEWVDSRIVTSLKCGQYILLEHVNLCSSAVLDRLNPVFEPNGSLLIAEKGISAKDTAEVVRKSPNFRAFLTADPKNQDKLYIRNAFANVFNCNAEQLNDIAEDVALYWTADKIYLNDVVLQREQVAFGAAQRQEQAPLMLSTQRQLLKQIVETVHMEKPLLLCGATDSGKTKLIDALCVLSNRVCNSDNIDDSVTGSFQQVS